MWSFVAVDPTYTINGVGPASGDLVNPSEIFRIDLGSVGGLDGFTDTVSIRNEALSPTTGTLPYADPAPGFTGILTSQTRTINLTVSDGSSYTSRTLVFYTASNSSDSFFNPLINFRQDGPSRWLGYDGANSQLPGSGSASAGAGGICMGVPGPGDNQVLWITPEDYVPLVDVNAYRLVVLATTDQTDVDSIPFWSFFYDNYHASGYGNVFGGESTVLDVDGGANGILRPQGSAGFNFWFSPNCALLPQWRGLIDTADSAFTPAASPNTGMRLAMRVNDLGSGTINADADSGYICIGTLRVTRFPFSELHSDATVWTSSLDSLTMFAQTLSQATESGTAQFNVSPAVAFYQIPEPPAPAPGAGTAPAYLRKTLGPFDSAAFDALNPMAYGPLYPIQWNSNELLLARANIVSTLAAGQPLDPIDVISNVLNTANFELGQTQNSTRGSVGNFHLAASPRPLGGAPQEYIGLFHTNTSTVSSVPNADKIRAMMDFFNTNYIGTDGTGADPFAVMGFKVERILQP